MHALQHCTLRRCLAGAMALAANHLHAQGGQSSTATSVAFTLARRYMDGERMAMHISGTNERPGHRSRYEADLDAVVTRDSSGRFIERITWSHVTADGVAAHVDMAQGQQIVSLAPDVAPQPPDLRRMDRTLVAPALDFLTFYVDLWVAMKQGALVHAGDHVYLAQGVKGSWADGRRVVLGEDGIDFDITLKAIDPAKGVARLLVRHVPPAALAITLPGAWMTTPVDQRAATRTNPVRPNNWVQVERSSSGGADAFVAGVGRETFDVELTVALANGRLMAATMENPVDVMERTCATEVLTGCGNPTRYRIRRRIELHERP